MADIDPDQQRRECEARYWLKRGFTSKEKVAELEKLLTSTRGANGVAYLVEEMRRQWGRRAEWLGGRNG
ncbi:DUF7696 family protein [Pseudomonas kuykendallii]|uniref:Regulatory protein RecX n=1 Tax=Pseudomonas kuykendallii TaxID=1007099 RepID=A0A2W5F688_9PSED|nr:hypothetical protein [Pseudomonas kuykendallii]PZP26712.1 MAG: hypothetical protein DI599_00715 [Pseudomonas kuykendallii]